MDLMTRRQALLARVEETSTEYVLDVVNGVAHPISIPISAGQKIRIRWSNVTLNDYTTMLFRLLNDASFVETSGTSSTTAGIWQEGERQYTVATDGVIVYGGRIPYPATLWETYAMRGEGAIVIT